MKRITGLLGLLALLSCISCNRDTSEVVSSINQPPPTPRIVTTQMIATINHPDGTTITKRVVTTAVPYGKDGNPVMEVETLQPTVPETYPREDNRPIATDPFYVQNQTQGAADNMQQQQAQQQSDIVMGSSYPNEYGQNAYSNTNQSPPDIASEIGLMEDEMIADTRYPATNQNNAYQNNAYQNNAYQNNPYQNNAYQQNQNPYQDNAYGNAYENPYGNAYGAADPSPTRSYGNAYGSSEMPEDVNYMTEREWLMIEEINLVRTNPSAYIPYIVAYKQKIQQDVYTDRSLLEEEIEAIDELVTELREMNQLSNLTPHRGVYDAAYRHGQDQKARDKGGHVGEDGSYPWERILTAAPDLEDGNENLVGGPADIREAIIMLLVDSDTPSRESRRTLLDPTWRFIACCEVGTLAGTPNNWIQNFAK